MNQDRGFTLIEVLIALTILAIALTAIMLAVQTSIKNTNRIRDKLAAHWVAMNILSSMQVGLLLPPTDQIAQGDSDLLGKKYMWQASIDHAENGYYERITIDVRLAGTSSRLEHLVGFYRIRNPEVDILNADAKF